MRLLLLFVIFPQQFNIATKPIDKSDEDWKKANKKTIGMIR